MSFQFFRIETYSRKPAKVKGSKEQYNSVLQILLEVLRNPAYSEHVDQPLPPSILTKLGALHPKELQAMHDRLIAEVQEQVKGANGTTYSRRLREDAKTLYTEIHSHPMTPDEFKYGGPEAKQTVKLWVSKAIKDFKRRMPEDIRFSAVIHMDEGHVHMHILALNTGDPKLDANKLHVGKVAAAAVRAHAQPSETIVMAKGPELEPWPLKPKKPKPSKNRQTQKKNDTRYTETLEAWEADKAAVAARNAEIQKRWAAELKAKGIKAGAGKTEMADDQKAYFAALQQLQDDYYTHVGKPCGLLRKGPGSERLPASIYKARKKTAQKAAEALRAQEQGAMALAAEVGALKKREERVALKEEETSQVAEQQARTAGALKAWEDDLTQLDASLAEQQAGLDECRSALTQEIRHSRAEAAHRSAAQDKRDDTLKLNEQGVGHGLTLLEHLTRQAEYRQGLREQPEEPDAAFAFINKIKTTPPDQRSRMQTVVLALYELIRPPKQDAGGRFEPERDLETPGF